MFDDRPGPWDSDKLINDVLGKIEFFVLFLIVYLRRRHRLQEPVFMQSHDND